ncbi:transposase [Pseudomonas sp. D2-3]
MLPDQCVPILVTDAGFHRPWFQAVEAKGWYYVGRVRNRDLYRDEQGYGNRSSSATARRHLKRVHSVKSRWHAARRTGSRCTVFTNRPKAGSIGA